MEKKFIKSKLVITLYVLAALVLIYGCYLVGSTVAYVASYYSSYSMTPAIGETVGYVLQAAYQPLVMSVLLFAAGFILNEVRRLNPDYYVSEEELKAAKEAKKAVKAEEKPEAEAVEAEEAKEDPKAEKKAEKKAVKEVKANAKMTKAELLEIAKKKGVKVTDKNTKAEILEALK